MKYLQTLVFFIISFNSYSQKLKLEDGVYIEVQNPNDSTLHKYTNDNISYKLNKTFIFNYYYIDSLNRKFKFIENLSFKFNNPLNLIHTDSLKGNYIEKLKLTVSDPDLFSSFDSSYTETVFSYNYLNNKPLSKDSICSLFKRNNRFYNQPCGDEYTGVIDNRINLWIHPPRIYTFRILQLCPYPFYYLDNTVNEWEWNLTTNGVYLDSRWITFSERITINYNYKRMPDEYLKTPFGILQCKVTYATGILKKENAPFFTSLKSYYHPKYGFVKLEYQLVNKAKMVINLIEMTN